MNYLTLVQILQALRMVFDIIIVWILLYYVIKIVRSNNRTVQIFKGIFFIIIVQAVAKYFGFDTLAYLTDNIVNWGFLALIIIFQPEIRAVLEKVGKSNVFNRMNTLSGTEKEGLVQALMDAASNLAESKTGALITIEQTTSLSEYAKTGVHMNSEVSAELLCSIFQTTTPLHDGAVIIQGDRLSSASVYFPPTQLDLPSRYGARHRAAIGISEISDAITIVVSEETGRVAIAEQGKLIKMNEKKLRAYLNRVILNRDTVADEMVSSVPSESVSIDSLFKKEMNAAEEELKLAKTQEIGKTDLPKTNAAPGNTSVVIIDETEDDEKDNTPVVHVAEMKTFGKADFHADLAAPAARNAEPEESDEDDEPFADESRKEKRGLFQFLRKDKKTQVEKAVTEVAKDYTTQQLKLKEIEEANEKLEAARQQTLSQTKKITVPAIKNEKTGTVKTIPVVELPKEESGETTTVTPKVGQVRIAKVDLPKRQEVEITDLPPVKPIEITQVQRRTQAVPKVTVFNTAEEEGKDGGTDAGK
ncbi:MAG: diadenylate cyclase CdaA [Erysipelotrichales bacterium]|nr:diadenylate cyclase CdaA [Erysipelotrichales bacterium]